MNKFVDAQKTLEAILYVSQHTHDLFHIVKTLFYADKIHLQNYGRLITDDYYRAMKDGPVPSGAYDLVKIVRGEDYEFDQKLIDVHPEASIKVTERKVITPLREPNLDYLSESDIEALDEAIAQYSNMDINQLWNLVHDEESYKKAGLNNRMQMHDIIDGFHNKEEIYSYLYS